MQRAGMFDPPPAKLAAFDIEIAHTGIPADVGDILAHRPLGVTCGAILGDGWASAHLVYHGEPVTITGSHQACQSSAEAAQGMIEAMEDVVRDGYLIVSWNGAGFDFPVLAEEAGLAWHDRAVALCRGHVDMMQMFVVAKGYRKGLDNVAAAMGAPGKLKRVLLRDGTIHEGMAGVDAPRLWAAGERQAVLDYLVGDVVSTLAVARLLRETGILAGTSRKGAPVEARFTRLMTVADCLGARVAYQGWMDPPWPSPAEATEWFDNPRGG